MAGAVSEILVKIKANSKQMQSELKKANGAMAQSAEKFKKAGMVMVAAGGAITAGFVKMITTTVAYGERLDKARKITGLTAEEFSKMAYAIEQEHGSLEALEKGLVNLTVRLGYAGDGLATYLRYFTALGIEFRKADGTLRDTYDVFLDIADAVSKGKLSTEKMAAVMQMFGARSAKELIPMLKKGREYFKEMGDEAESLGIVMTDEVAASMKRVSDSMLYMKKALLGVVYTMGAELAPTFKSIVDLAGKMIQRFQELPKWLKELIAKGGALSGVLLLVGGGMALIIGYIPALIAGLTSLHLTVGSVTIAFTALAAAMLLVVTAKEYLRWGKEDIALKKLDKTLDGFLARQDELDKNYKEGNITREEYRKGCKELAKDIIDLEKSMGILKTTTKEITQVQKEAKEETIDLTNEIVNLSDAIGEIKKIVIFGPKELEAFEGIHEKIKDVSEKSASTLKQIMGNAIGTIAADFSLEMSNAFWGMTADWSKSMDNIWDAFKTTITRMIILMGMLKLGEAILPTSWLGAFKLALGFAEKGAIIPAQHGITTKGTLIQTHPNEAILPLDTFWHKLESTFERYMGGRDGRVNIMIHTSDPSTWIEELPADIKSRMWRRGFEEAKEMEENR